MKFKESVCLPTYWKNLKPMVCLGLKPWLCLNDLMDLLNNVIKKLYRDFSISSLLAACLIVTVGITSSAALIFESAKTLGLSLDIAGSWLGSLCIGAGLISVVFSIRYQIPILFAWSTPGAALLITSLEGHTYSDAIGAFLFSAFLIFLSGITGVFEKIMNRIPVGMTSALLAGVLLQFCINTFLVIKIQPVLVLSMLVTYFLCRRHFAKYAMLLVVLMGVLVAFFLSLFHVSTGGFAWTTPYFVFPTFSLASVLGVGLPLFIVTMASQNLTGLSVMRAYGYNKIPISSLFTWSGIINIFTAPFGGFALNLAAITAAIGMSPEAHPDREKRYITGVLSGTLYILAGLCAGTVAYLFEALPQTMITALVGIALLPALASSMTHIFSDKENYEASFVTFLATASGLSLAGIGSAFWGLIAGLIVQMLLYKKQKSQI